MSASPKCALDSCTRHARRHGSLVKGKIHYSLWCMHHDQERLYSGGILVAEDDDWHEPVSVTGRARRR